MEQYQQANARLYRQGQEQPVIIHHLVTKDTIDEQIMKALQSKAAGQDALLEAVKAKIYELGGDMTQNNFFMFAAKFAAYIAECIPADNLFLTHYVTILFAKILKPIFGGVFYSVDRPYGGLFPIVYIIQNMPHAFFQRDFRLPIEHFCYFRYIGKSTIRLAGSFGNMYDIGIFAAQKFNQTIDGIGMPAIILTTQITTEEECREILYFTTFLVTKVN